MLGVKNFTWTGLIVLIGAMSVYPAFLLRNEQVLAEEFLVKERPLSISLSHSNTLLAVYPTPQINPSDVVATISVVVTAYSSSPWETQGDPFITASGERVRDGIVANNLLPFGTKIRLPKLFGDKVFVVKDRMNSRKGPYHIDIWFPSREKALQFGAHITKMEILR